MLNNLLAVTGVIIVLWAAGYVFYLITSRQQQNIAEALQALQKKLDAQEPDAQELDAQRRAPKT